MDQLSQGQIEFVRKERVFKRGMSLIIINTILILLALLLSGCSQQEGRVLNGDDNTPIVGATIYHNGQVAQSDNEGRFKLNRPDLNKPLLVKAVGFRRISVPLKRYIRPNARLESFQAKAVYLSHAGVGAAHLRNPVLDLIAETDVNAVVVDVKGQRGLFSFSWEIPIGHQIGAFSKITIEDPDAFIHQMREKNIYVIGRVCVFKDEALANNKSEWAAIDPKSNKPFRDTDKIPWMDPFRKEVWEYNLAIAKAAAEVGFDEIQFDYLRFPTAPVKYSKENTKEAREGVIKEFLAKAQKELQPYNVYLSVATSGISLWKQGDADIGQDLAIIAPLVDYISPYIFPSDLPAGALNLKTNAAAVPGEAVTAALEMGIQRIGNQPEKIRPWLQSFKDYSRLRREFKEEEIAEEIAACADAGTAGWIFFNPENKYPYVSGALEKAKQHVSGKNKIAQVQP
ncbi:MAG: GTP-binding protein [Verrucomicrobia bacterium]|nr:GTP-binding protein [Verrucomicrobiota bacterium]